MQIAQFSLSTYKAAVIEARRSVGEHQHSLASAHEDELAEVTPPVAPPVEPPDEGAIIARHEHEQLSSIAFWRRSARRKAKARAHEAAADEIRRELQKREKERREQQAQLDEAWRRLLANDRHAVFKSIEAAFEDNEFPAAPLDIHCATAALMMKIGSPGELIPEREMTTTPTGRPSQKRRPKDAINALYAEILASHVIATVKEAFAVAPGLQIIQILTIRGDRLGGGLQLIPLYVGEFDRASVQQEGWKLTNVLAFIEAHGSIRYKGQAQEVAPLATKTDPELRAVIDDLANRLGWKPAP